MYTCIHTLPTLNNHVRIHTFPVNTATSVYPSNFQAIIDFMFERTHLHSMYKIFFNNGLLIEQRYKIVEYAFDQLWFTMNSRVNCKQR